MRFELRTEANKMLRVPYYALVLARVPTGALSHTLSSLLFASRQTSERADRSRPIEQMQEMYPRHSPQSSGVMPYRGTMGA